jgi:hypothetical protein
VLLGVPLRPQLPPLPQIGTDVEGIRKYLEALDQAVYVYISEVLVGAVGLLGVRGISSSGTAAQNFLIGPRAITTNPLLIRLLRTEADASYVLFIQLTDPVNTVLTGWTQATTYVNFSFTGLPPTGALIQAVLFR